MAGAAARVRRRGRAGRGRAGRGQHGARGRDDRDAGDDGHLRPRDRADAGGGLPPRLGRDRRRGRRLPALRPLDGDADEARAVGPRHADPGGTGDFPRIVLAPGDPADAFELARSPPTWPSASRAPCTSRSTRWSPRTRDRRAFDRVGGVHRGDRLREADLAALDEYRRYRDHRDGISPWAPRDAGRPEPRHRERARRVGPGLDRAREPGPMVDKRAQKARDVLPDLPRGRDGPPDAGRGTARLRDADRGHAGGGGAPRRGRAAVAGAPARDALAGARGRARLLGSLDRVSRGRAQRPSASTRTSSPAPGLPAERLESVLRYDGLPFRPRELVRRAPRAGGRAG